MTVVAHTAGDPRRLGTTIRSFLGGIDCELPVSKIQTLEDLVHHSVSASREAPAQTPVGDP